MKRTMRNRRRWKLACVLFCMVCVLTMTATAKSVNDRTYIAMLAGKSSAGRSPYGTVTSLKFKGNSVVLKGTISQIDEYRDIVKKVKCKSKKFKLSKNVRIYAIKDQKIATVSKAFAEKTAKRIISTRGMGLMMRMIMKGTKVTTIYIGS